MERQVKTLLYLVKTLAGINPSVFKGACQAGASHSGYQQALYPPPSIDLPVWWGIQTSLAHACGWLLWWPWPEYHISSCQPSSLVFALAECKYSQYKTGLGHYTYILLDIFRVKSTLTNLHADIFKCPFKKAFSLNLKTIQKSCLNKKVLSSLSFSKQEI